MKKKNKTQDQPIMVGTSGDSLREAFGKRLVELAKDFPKLVVLDGDVAGGTGAHHFRRLYPDQFYQIGIAEQNMMCIASGLSISGLLPVVTTFAAFCLRGIEQVRLSVAYSAANVKIVASHPGLDVGPDGGSAQALEDLAMFRSIPNMTVISPADVIEINMATRAILDFKGPVYMRTGRSDSVRILPDSYKFRIGKGQVLVDGTDVSIIACGVEVARSLEAAELLHRDGISARVINMSTIKPIDVELIKRCAVETGCFVTAEDHNVHGGLGSAVAEVVVENCPIPIEFVGVKDTFGESGDPEELATQYKITGQAIFLAAKLAVSRKMEP